MTRIFRALAGATRIALTWALLTPFFFLFCVPARLILCVGGRDPLQRRFPAPGPSCWEPRRPAQGRHRRPFA